MNRTRIAPARLHLIRRIAAAVWLTVSSIQLTSWVLICVIGAQLINPFWIWGTVGGGLIVGALWWPRSPGSRWISRPGA